MTCSRSTVTGRVLSGECWESLGVMASEIQNLAFAEGTHSNLSSQEKAYKEFCDAMGSRGFPASGELLLRYSIWLFLTGKCSTGQSIWNIN